MVSQVKSCSTEGSIGHIQQPASFESARLNGKGSLQMSFLVKKCEGLFLHFCQELVLIGQVVYPGKTPLYIGKFYPLFHRGNVKIVGQSLRISRQKGEIFRLCGAC